MPRPTRESLAIDHIADIYGERWLVAEYRPTAHGWPLALGWPAGMTGRQARPGVIVTLPLAEYLMATRLRDVVLPIGMTAIKRLRADLDLRWSWDDWWQARAADLRAMTLEAFCARHGCSIGAASQRRRSLSD